MRGHSGGVMSAVFSPDGACILTASDDHTARIWDAETGREIDLLRSFEYGVTSAVFSPDGTRVLAAADDQTVRIWDATRDLITNREITTLRGHLDGVASASFSPDGTRIVTASEDCTARIWDAATGHEITRIALDAAVTALAVRDGDIALGDALGRIHIFEAGEFLGTKRTD